MSVKLERFFLILICSLFAISSVKAQDVIISVDEHNPPFMYSDDETERAEGLYPKLLTFLFEKIGVPVRIQAIPWKRSLYFGETGQTGVGGLYKTSERERIFDFSDPLYIEDIHLFTQMSNESNPLSLEDLEGNTIGIIKGWSYGDEFDQHKRSGFFNVIELQSDEMNFRLLAKGHVDYILAIRESGDIIIAAEQMFDSVKMLPSPILTNPTYLAFSKKSGQRFLLGRINELISAMRRDGSYDRLIEDILKSEL